MKRDFLRFQLESKLRDRRRSGARCTFMLQTICITLLLLSKQKNILNENIICFIQVMQQTTISKVEKREEKRVIRNRREEKEGGKKKERTEKKGNSFLIANYLLPHRDQRPSMKMPPNKLIELKKSRGRWGTKKFPTYGVSWLFHFV